MDHDYADLKQRVEKAGLLQKQPRYYTLKILSNLSALALSLAIFWLIREPWVQALNAVFLAAIAAQFGFIIHDAGHRQMFKESWKNYLVGIIHSNLLMGLSYAWWNQKHNAHHANPNHVDLDPDIEIAAIAFSEEQALEKRGLNRLIAKYQAYLFFPLLLLQAYRLHWSSALYMLQHNFRNRKLEIALFIAHFVLYLGAGIYFLGPWSTLMIFIIQQSLGGFFLTSVFAPNHKGMLLLDSSTQLGFLRSQVLTARNVYPHPFVDFWYGALNYQVEHHLFPTMPRNKVPQAHRIVKEFCREQGINYYETSVLNSYREILDYLHTVSAPLRTNSQPTPVIDS